MEAPHRALVAADPASLKTVRRAVRQMVADLGASPELVWDVQLAVNELCTGLLLQAFPADEPPGLIEVIVSEEPGGVLVVVTDDGLGFDPVPHSEQAEVALQVLERITTSLEVFPSPYGRGSRVELRFARVRRRQQPAGRRRGRG